MIKKTSFIFLCFCATLGISPTIYADDVVTFYLKVPAQLTQGGFTTAPIKYTFEVKSDDGLLTKTAQNILQFGPHTNVYDPNKSISSSSPQKQSGDVTVIQYGPWGSFERCTAHWEHLFWKGNKEHTKHDTFSLYITSQYTPGACFPDKVTKSGQSAWISFTPPPPV